MPKAKSKKNKSQSKNKEFKLKFGKSKVLKTLVETLAATIDETNFEVTPEAFKVRAMDPSKICILEATIKKEFFDEFHCPVNCKIGLNLDDFEKILKRSNSDESIYLEFKEEEQKLIIQMKNQTKKTRTFKLTCLDIDTEDISMENLRNIVYTTSWSIHPDFFIEAIKDGEIYSEILNFLSIEHVGLKFSSSGTIGEMEYFLDLEDLDEDDLVDSESGMYSNVFLKSLMKIGPIISEMTMSLKTERPLKFEFKLHEGAELEYYLAPRVDREENSDDDESLEELEVE